MLANVTAMRWMDWFGVVGWLMAAAACGRVGYDQGDDGRPPVAASTEPVELSTTGSPEDPMIAWNGDSFGLAWQQEVDGVTQIMFAEVAEGFLVGEALQLSAATDRARDVAIAATSSGARAGWQQEDGSDVDIYVRSVGSVVGSAVAATDTTTSQDIAMVAGDGAVGMTWQEEIDGEFEIMFCSADERGVCDPQALRQLTATGEASEDPSITWNGSQFLVLWREDHGGYFQVHFATVDGEGNELASGQFTASEDDAEEAVATWLGDRYALIWEDDRAGSTELFYGLLSAAGEPLGGVRSLTPGAATAKNGSVVSVNDRVAASWQDDGVDAAYLQYLNLDGTAAAAEFVLGTANDQSGDPMVVWTGTELGAIWLADGGVYFSVAPLSSGN